MEMTYKSTNRFKKHANKKLMNEILKSQLSMESRLKHAILTY